VYGSKVPALCSLGGSIKVFIDARGGLCDCVAVRY
jgi:hypothetical protein